MPKPELSATKILRAMADWFDGDKLVGRPGTTEAADAWWILPHHLEEEEPTTFKFSFPQSELGTTASYRAAADAAESAAYSDAMLPAKWPKARPVCRKVRS